MTVPTRPAGGTVPARSPSRWGHRLPLVALALLGAAISAYLAAFQVGLLGSVWEPMFGDGSMRVLTSSLAAALPIPDAALGTIGYLVEAGLALVGGPHRWRDRPWLVLAFGAIVALMALAGLALVLVQIVGLRAGCTLCLTSAAISFVLAIGAWPEVRAAIGRLREQRSQAVRRLPTPAPQGSGSTRPRTERR